MSEIDLDAIKARADAATPGPWHVHSASMGIRGAGEPYAWVMTPDNAAVVERHNGGTVADAEFIAHARADVPALLARIAELEAQLERATNAWADAKIRGSRLATTVRNALDAVKDGTDD